MPDIAQISTSAHRAFEVPVTIDDIECSAVLHLDVESWGADGLTVTRMDMISVRADVDELPSRGSMVACSDLSAVPSPRTWVITDRAPIGGDGHVLTWHMRRTDA